jgi:DNA-binding CsgD family transcriptional regulator
MKKADTLATGTRPSTEFIGDFGKTVLNSLSAHIAILDARGRILETNKAWQAFAKKGRDPSPNRFIGANYLQICDNAKGDGAEDAHAVAQGIRSVIKGDVEEFLYDYPCHAPTEQHWFYMRAICMKGGDPVRVVVSHEEITQLKQAEEALKQSKSAVEEQKRELEEANIALKVLLKQRENDKAELEQKVLANIKNLVLPYVEKLKRAPLRAKDKTTVDIIDTHLKDIISPLMQRLANINILLTPQELQVATLVKDGRSSKEIADILAVSETTVHFHRKNLRRKFGIKSSAKNLRSYLMSIT